ncbi:MAG: ABC transporter substrate-binding protein [Xanthobacteraceae bacterium]
MQQWKRREAMTLLGGATAAWSLSAGAQQGERVRRIGLLYGGSEADTQAQAGVAAFLNGLRELGWVPGQNIAIEQRFAGGDGERMRVLARELIDLRPELVVAQTTPAVAALQVESRTIPIVFVVVSDPVGSGFVESLAQPRGNITGFVNLEGTLGSKWIELLKETIPRIAHAGIIFNPNTAPYWHYYVRPFETAARSLAVEPKALTVASNEYIEQTIAGLAAVPGGGLVVMPDIFTATTHQLGLIISLAARHRVPTVYPYRFMVSRGGLISYGIDTLDLWRRAPAYVNRILKGARPADLPVQLPTKFELAINLSTAKELAIEMPASLLARADEVVE